MKEKLRDAIRALNKPVRYIMTHELAGFMISKNQESHLDPISDIYSIGFSFSNVDMPYIKEVLSYLPGAGEKNITWHLCDFDDDNKKKAFKQKIIEFGFKGKFGDYFKL